MQFVSFETAKKLKDSFPAPTPQFGQVWYHTDTTTFAVTPVLVGSALWTLIEGKNKIFAPTATEILEVLGSRFVLWFDNSPKRLRWYCAKTGNFTHDAGAPYGDENPANACAKAYLAQF